MTRLADALERAGRSRPEPAHHEPAPPATPPAAPAPVLTLVNGAGDTRPGGVLIGAPRADKHTGWRTDPNVLGKLVGTEGFPGAAQEQYRKLAATLHHAQVERGLKVIMTASALPSEGKSLTAGNLALTLSESYKRRVLLIDADLRRPSIQRLFALPPLSGLTEALRADEDYPIATLQISDRLTIMSAGRPTADPIGGITSSRMKRIAAEAAATFDWVIIDTPPIGLLPDANLLSELVDGVLLVVRSGRAPFHLVKRTVEAVSRDKILGVVMNAVDFAHDRNAGGYYEYYGYGYYGTKETS